MLGAARASQYAGWWTAGNISATANLTSVSSLSYKRKITPSYSYLMEVDSSEVAIGYSVGRFSSDQYIDITGLTGFTGYNNLNMTMCQHFYLPWSNVTGASTNGQFRFDLKQSNISGTSFDTNIYAGQDGGSGKLYITVDYPGGGQTLNTTDSYSNYNDRWLTVVFSTSNTSSNFTSFSSSTGSGNVYARIALYDTQAGTLIQKYDFRTNEPGWNLSTLPATFTSNPDNDDWWRIFGYAGGTYANNYDYRIQNCWISVGTMFDPLTTTDTTWLTSNPNKQISNAVSWFNSQFNDYTYRNDFDTTGTQGVSLIANTDLYVNNKANSNFTNINFDSANSNVFLTQYSNTVVLMNGGA